MSLPTEAASIVTQAEAIVPPLPSRLQKLEAKLEEWGDRLNPILVKESRQALKSRQFVITFSLLLLCGWIWSVIGLVLNIPQVFYAPTGVYMLGGYYFILAIPMITIVPFSTYRSLAAERDDGTYELLSVSTLTSRQIVTGKLGSAILQMIVYYSALAPCVAFTYMLRGVDILSVFILLAYTFCASILLSSASLVLASLARSRNLQAAISMLLMAALLGAGFTCASVVGTILSGGLSNIPVDEPLFWIVSAAILTAWATYVVLFLQVAAAQNSFASDNRSTRVRIALFVQTALFVAWVAYFWLQFGNSEFLVAMLCFSGFHWYLYGMLLTAESDVLSPRVRRDLPESTLGRMFLTSFNPGSGTGYLFSIAHVIGLCSLVCVAIVIQDSFGTPIAQWGSIRNSERFVGFAFLAASYYIAYQGVPRLIYLALPNRHQLPIIVPIVLNILILVVGASVPFIGNAFNSRFNTVFYTEWQFTNWAWTLAQLLDGPSNVSPWVYILVGSSALLIFCLNMVVTGREIEAVRAIVPVRVQLEHENAFQPQALSEAASRIASTSPPHSASPDV